MGIVDKIEAFVNETKEMSLKKVMDKIEGGYWEAEEDVKVGKHITIRDTKTNKKIVVYITEDLDEATGLKFTKKDKASWESQAKKMGLTIKAATDSDGESNKMWNAKDKQGNTKGEFHVDKGGFLKEDLNEGFKVTTGVQGSLSINGKSIAKTQKVGNNVFVMIDKEDGDKTRIPVPNGKNMMASEIAEWLEDYLKKNPKALTESSYEEGSLDFILEADKMPLTLKIGDSFKTNEGSIKITDITVSSLHMKPITYITYKYDVVIDGKPLKGEEKASLNSFKDHFKK